MREKFRQLYKEDKIPSGVFKINGAECVYDIQLMIKTHLDMLDGSSSDQVKRPYKLRLEKLYKQLNK
jgi:hypothetical protein